MPENVYDSVRPLLLLLKISGNALYSVDSKTFKVTFTVIDASLLIFHLIIVITLNFIYWNTSFLMDFCGSEIVKTYYPNAAYLNFVAFALTKVWMFCQRYKYGELLELIQEIDCDLQLLGFKFDYMKQSRNIVRMILLSNSLGLISSFAFYIGKVIYDLNVSITVVIFTCYAFHANLVVISKFFILVCGVKERYTAMKEILK